MNTTSIPVSNYRPKSLPDLTKSPSDLPLSGKSTTLIGNVITYCYIFNIVRFMRYILY